MSVSVPHHLVSLEEWARLDPEVGPVELVEGVLHVPPRPASRHQIVLGQVVQQLNDALPESWIALAEVDLVVHEAEPATVRTPDVVVVPAEPALAGRGRWHAEEVALVAEVVSPGTQRTDRVMKASEYAEAGIPTYWLVDPEAPVTVTALRLTGAVYSPAPSVDVTVDGATVGLDVTRLGRR